MFWLWPLLAAVAGTGMQMAGAEKVKSKSNQMLNAELGRQRQIQERSRKIAAQSQAESTPQVVNQQIDAGQDKYEGAYNQARNVPLSASATTSGLQRSASSTNDKREGVEGKRSDQARAQVMGYNEWDLQRAIKNLLYNQQLAIQGNFAQGSERILPLELNNAQHAGDSLMGAGQLLQALGMIGGMYNLAPAGPSAAATNAASHAANAGFTGGSGATGAFFGNMGSRAGVLGSASLF